MRGQERQNARLETNLTADRRGGRAIVFMLCTIIATAILLYGAVDSGTLAVLSILSFVIIVFWIWQAFRGRAIALDADALLLPLLALMIIGVVQLLPLVDAGVPSGVMTVRAVSSLTLDPYATRFFLMRLFLFIIFFAAALTFINSTNRLRAVVIFLISFSALLAFYSILQRVEDPGAIYGLRQPAQAIPFGTFINRHHFAALLEMPLGLAIGVLFAGGLVRNRWPFAVVAAAVMGIAIVLTGSRGGMIGLFSVVGLIVILASLKSRSRATESESVTVSRKALALAGFAFIALTIGLVLFAGGADPLLRGAGIDQGAGDFSSGRIQFWQTAVKIFLDHPVIGVGLDGFGAAYSQYDASNGAFRVEQAHNDYLQILADGGLLGFACVAAFVFLLFRKGLAVVRSSKAGFRRGAAIGALAGCFGILVHSFFDFPLRTPANAFMFLALAAIAVVNLPEQSHHRHHRHRESAELI